MFELPIIELNRKLSGDLRHPALLMAKYHNALSAHQQKDADDGFHHVQQQTKKMSVFTMLLRYIDESRAPLILMEGENL